MPRIIAGRARGRQLVIPRGEATRPTSDRAREAMFSAIEALRGPWARATVVDLYAGSGALGLEALSRGAGHVVLVENAPAALTALRANVVTLGEPSAVVRATSVEAFVASLSGPVGLEGALRADVVLADPPYATPAATVRALLAAMVDAAALGPGAVVVVERASADPAWSWPAGIEALRERAYGAATLWYGRAAVDSTPTGG